MNERITTATRRLLGQVPERIEALKRDGSNRSYARVYIDGRTVVAMLLAADDAHRRAEEVGGDLDVDLTVPPFVAIQAELLGLVPVPAVYGYDATSGVILLEDLGSLHLADAFAPNPPLAAYREALDDLVRFQAWRPATNSLVARRHYDRELWQWEFEHFCEYGLKARGGVVLTPAAAADLDAAFAALSQRIAALPQVPVHRDFHSRNLMLDASGRVRWLDFQDALMGPAVYDVASLLYDAYVKLPDSDREALFAEWVDAATRAGVALGHDPYTDMQLVALQRMLKAAGRFEFFLRVKHLQGYVEYIPELVTRCRQLMAQLAARVPEVGVLAARFAEAAPEWR